MPNRVRPALSFARAASMKIHLVTEADLAKAIDAVFKEYGEHGSRSLTPRELAEKVFDYYDAQIY